MSYQFTPIKTLKDKAYFGLRIAQNSIGTDIERAVFLKDYSESFTATWDIPEKPFGMINSDYRYVQTNRKVDITFDLPARNVKDSLENLKFCESMAKIVYGRYNSIGQVGLGPSPFREQFTFEGALTDTKLSFGNLIRNEPGFFSKFSFTPDFGAGVFEWRAGYGSYQEKKGEVLFPNYALNETSFLSHAQPKRVYPKLITVTFSFTVVHDNLLGFGGPLRPGKPLSWAENRNRDWPHGTGKDYPVPDYMKTSRRPSQAAATAITGSDGTTVLKGRGDAPNITFAPDGTLIVEGEDWS
jgi:hypothetical protein